MFRNMSVFGFVCAFALLAFTPATARVMDGQAILHQVASANTCAVTFDDGPSQFTSQLLDSLQNEGIRATFFVLGRQVERHPDIIQRMVREGHEVGSHSYSHPNFRKLNPTEQLLQLSKTTALLNELGVTPVSFRPPYGKYSAVTVELASELGMSVVLWSSDSQDWKRRPADYSQMSNVTGRPSLPGTMHGIFLFHDIRKATVEDLPRIVATLRAGGCERFVTVKEYMDSDFGEPPMYTALPPVNAPEAVVARNGSLNATHPASVAETGQEEDDLMAQNRTSTPAPDASATTATTTTEESSAAVPLARSNHPWTWLLFNSGT
ncbi:MAG: polysaccharide deacetylase family protein [Desulfovibrionaceae bacterium]